MDSIKRHLSLFPARLRKVLEKYDHWDQICEIRLRTPFSDELQRKRNHK